MQTTPPMVIASAPNAGAVHPCTRNTAAVAIRVAMVMPDTGLADEPTRPTIRELTVTKRNPKTTTSRDAARLAGQPTILQGKDGIRNISVIEVKTCFFLKEEDGIRDIGVTGVQTCALPISPRHDPAVPDLLRVDLLGASGLGRPPRLRSRCARRGLDRDRHAVPCGRLRRRGCLPEEIGRAFV